MKINLIFRTIATVALAIASTAMAYAYSPQQLNIHCSADTTAISKLLNDAYNEPEKPNGASLIYFAEKLLGTPYVAGTLEGTPEMLTIRIDGLDCTTFVETIMALNTTAQSRRISWRDFAQNLERVRYRNGEINGYASRLHYVSDWILNNSARGIVRDITPDIPGATYMVKTLDYMSTHRDKYPALADSATFEKLKSAEIGYRSHRYPLVKKSAFNSKGAKKMLRNGDIVVFITKTEGLDASHMGIIKIINNEPYLLHASSAAGKVTLETEKISETLRRSLSTIGVRVVRVLE